MMMTNVSFKTINAAGTTVQQFGVSKFFKMTLNILLNAENRIEVENKTAFL